MIIADKVGGKTLYARLLEKLLGRYDFDKKRVLYYSAMVVKHFCPESFSDIDLTWDDRCFRLLFMILASGKACCHLEDDEKYAWVREHYIDEKCGIRGKDKI